MTCIVAVKQDNIIYMAGDRAASNEAIIGTLSTPKVFKKDEFLIGYAGSMAGKRLAYHFDPPSPPPYTDIDEYMHTTFLNYLRELYEQIWIADGEPLDLDLIIGIRGRLYDHNVVNMSLNEYSRDYMAIGSGMEYAYGYLYSGANASDPYQRASGAVKSAIEFSPSCGGDIDIVYG
jgi:20S proteasome alpha/beta subunit